MIYVDKLTDYSGMTKLRYKVWCHMVSDIDESDLHAFARLIGLKLSWAQLRPKHSAAHYDLVPTKRDLAIKHGAVEVTSRELVLLNYDGLRRRGLLKLYPHQEAELVRRGLLWKEPTT